MPKICLVLASLFFNKTDNFTAVNTSKNSAGTKSLGASNGMDIELSFPVLVKRSKISVSTDFSKSPLLIYFLTVLP